MASHLIAMMALLVMVTSSFGQVEENDPPESGPQPQQMSAALVGRIAGGEAAEEGRFPYIVSIRLPGLRNHVCGGALIHTDWVITAAHCVDPRRGFSPTATSAFPVYIGGLKRTAFNESRMGTAMVHPSWDGNTLSGYDISLVKLNESSSLQPVKLVDSGTSLQPGDPLAAMGWGRLQERGGFAEVLQLAVGLPFISEEACAEALSMPISNMLCAGQGLAGACAGDQGGPLIRISPNNNASKDVLVGIATAVNSFRTATCSQVGVPGVYTSIEAVLPFIKDILQLQ